jgi:hypothetical protein
VKFIPVTLSQDMKPRAVTRNSAAISDSGEKEAVGMGNKQGVKDNPPRGIIEHLINAEDFLIISSALISDLLYYSKKIRDEYIELTPKLIRESSLELISGRDIVDHWRNFFRLSTAYFRNLEPQTDLLYSFLGVMIATVMVVFGVQLLIFVSRPNWLSDLIDFNQIEDPIANILLLVFILVSMIILLPAAFYLINALVSVTARFLGGQGKLASLNYMSSLIIVPMSIFQFFGILIFPLGMIGLSFGSVLFLAITAYGFLQYIKITQVVFKLNANKAWLAILIPIITISVFLFSLFMLIVLITP